MQCSAYDIGEINITLIKIKDGGVNKGGREGFRRNHGRDGWVGERNERGNGRRRNISGRGIKTKL